MSRYDGPSVPQPPHNHQQGPHTAAWAGAYQPPDGPGPVEAVRRTPTSARRHLLPGVAVFAAISAFMLFTLLMFSLVFALDDAVEPGEIVGALASGFGTAAGVAAVCVVLGLLLDRATGRAPTWLRIVAPAVLPLAGLVVLAAGGAASGLPLLLVGLVFCGYWAMFLAQAALARVWVQVRSRRTTSR